MSTTNYYDTFIQVAEDCPVQQAATPPERPSPTVARLQFELLRAEPYAMTSDDLLFAVHARRKDIPEQDRDQARTAFFARSQACLRASPLPQRYGWGIHHDAEGRIALVAAGTEDYRRFAEDEDLAQVRAMRSSRR
ncbi:hypothetical protein BF93_16055 [Brachybacterium phenoliresistens]|uniref:Uncharacterized protein n=1 Tax=Brachybacterium phenoliresistens TaxID=396014 RepID=Z9JTH3_9MICO|nr:DUF6157 family protein [Brachybacterium phenoliresistens]EWS81675.1 hypothetical protein BF93_16055 [Brachybacterium phenoliresistens]